MGTKGKIIVTGGGGYIGSHTIIELVGSLDHEVVSIDDHSNSDPATFDRIERITGKRITNHEIDLCDKKKVMELLASLGSITGIIHFAAYKSVPESMAEPYKYYHNNIASLLNILQATVAYDIPHFIFSSSCSVYGNIEQLPVNEDTTLGHAESPYAFTKQVGERIIGDHARILPKHTFLSLRYFNPVGAHMSGLLGEDPINPPTSLVPVLARKAAGLIKEVVVHGDDYDTRDGSCIRDFVHVSDIATAHVRALEFSMRAPLTDGQAIFNLGSGNGVSVLEAIHAFEKVTGQDLDHRIGPRRSGDVAAIYSDTNRSRTILGWEARHSLEDMMASAWAWEQHLQKARPISRTT